MNWMPPPGWELLEPIEQPAPAAPTPGWKPPQGFELVEPELKQIHKEETDPAVKREMETTFPSLKPDLSEFIGAARKEAKSLGMVPEHYLTGLLYESPELAQGNYWQQGPRTKWGQHRGAFQWGEPQAAEYGVHEGMSISDQLAAGTRYLTDRGFKSGGDLLDFYSTINAGAPGRYGASDRPGETVQSHVQRMLAERLPEAQALLAQYPEASDRMFGYKVRQNLFPGEEEFFRTNPGTSGMAAETGDIILNPYAQGTNQQAVAENEAFRLMLRDNGIIPDFALTDQQKAAFSNTPYGKDEKALKETIAARIYSGDPSALATPQQTAWVESVSGGGRPMDMAEEGPTPVAWQPPKGYELIGPEPPAPEPASFGEHFARGADITQKAGYDFAQWFGQVVGNKEIEAWGKSGSDAEGREIKNQKQLLDPFEIQSLSEAGQFVKGVFGEQIPIMAGPMAGGLAGAGAGFAVGGPLGATIGGALGAFAPSMVLGTGMVQGTLEEKGVESAPGWVFAGGTAVATLDTVIPGKMGSMLVKKFGAEVAEEMAEKFLTRTLKGAGKGMAFESGTEFTQELFEEVAAAQGANAKIDWPSALKQGVTAGIAGGIMGGGIGGSVAAIPSKTKAEETEQDKLAPEALQDRIDAFIPPPGYEIISPAGTDGAGLAASPASPAPDSAPADTTGGAAATPNVVENPNKVKEGRSAEFERIKAGTTAGEYEIDNAINTEGPTKVRLVQRPDGAFIDWEHGLIDVGGMVTAGMSPEEIIARSLGDHTDPNKPDLTKVRPAGKPPSNVSRETITVDFGETVPRFGKGPQEVRIVSQDKNSIGLEAVESGKRAKIAKPLWEQIMHEPRRRAELHKSLADLLESGVTDPEQIYSHPAMAETTFDQEVAEPKTSTHPLYASPGYRARREFDFDGEKVIGYRKATEKLAEKGRSFAGEKGVAKERHATIAIGAPGAGKSTIVEGKIARARRAAVVDADIAKKALPEFKGGRGAQAVHKESRALADRQLTYHIERGENIVTSMTGQYAGGVLKVIERLKAAGYKVDVINVKTDELTTAKRIAKRFLETGRPITPDYARGAVKRAARSYMELRHAKAADRFAEIDTTGEPTITQDGEAVLDVEGLRDGRARGPARERPQVRPGGGARQARSARRLRPRSGQSFTQFIASIGGIKDVGGNLKSMGMPKHRGVWGVINDKTGLDPDKAREAAVAAGFIRERPYEQEAQTTIDDLLDLLDRAYTQGEKIYAFGNEGVAEERAAREKQLDPRDELDHIIGQIETAVPGFQVRPEEQERAARLYAQGVDPYDIADRLSMESEHQVGGEETRRDANARGAKKGRKGSAQGLDKRKVSGQAAPQDARRGQKAARADESLASSVKRQERWVEPSDESLAQEYKIKQAKNDYLVKQYPTEKAWIEAVRRGRVVEVPPELDAKIARRTHTKTQESLLNSMKGYASYPKFRNEKTLQRLYDRVKAGEPLDMPLIYVTEDGRMTVRAGNTRLDVAAQSGVTPKAILFGPGIDKEAPLASGVKKISKPQAIWDKLPEGEWKKMTKAQAKVIDHGVLEKLEGLWNYKQGDIVGWVLKYDSPKYVYGVYPQSYGAAGTLGKVGYADTLLDAQAKVYPAIEAEIGAADDSIIDEIAKVLEGTAVETDHMSEDAFEAFVADMEANPEKYVKGEMQTEIHEIAQKVIADSAKAMFSPKGAPHKPVEAFEPWAQSYAKRLVATGTFPESDTDPVIDAGFGYIKALNAEALEGVIKKYIDSKPMAALEDALDTAFKQGTWHKLDKSEKGGISDDYEIWHLKDAKGEVIGWVGRWISEESQKAHPGWYGGSGVSAAINPNTDVQVKQAKSLGEASSAVEAILKKAGKLKGTPNFAPEKKTKSAADADGWVKVRGDAEGVPTYDYGDPVKIHILAWAEHPAHSPSLATPKYEWETYSSGKFIDKHGYAETLAEAKAIGLDMAGVEKDIKPTMEDGWAVYPEGAKLPFQSGVKVPKGRIVWVKDKGYISKDDDQDKMFWYGSQEEWSLKNKAPTLKEAKQKLIDAGHVEADMRTIVKSIKKIIGEDESKPMDLEEAAKQAMDLAGKYLSEATNGHSVYTSDQIGNFKKAFKDLLELSKPPQTVAEIVFTQHAHLTNKPHIEAAGKALLEMWHKWHGKPTWSPAHQHISDWAENHQDWSWSPMTNEEKNELIDEALKWVDKGVVPTFNNIEDAWEKDHPALWAAVPASKLMAAIEKALSLGAKPSTTENYLKNWVNQYQEKEGTIHSLSEDEKAVAVKVMMELIANGKNVGFNTVQGALKAASTPDQYDSLFNGISFSKMAVEINLLTEGKIDPTPAPSSEFSKKLSEWFAKVKQEHDEEGFKPGNGTDGKPLSELKSWVYNKLIPSGGVDTFVEDDFGWLAAATADQLVKLIQEHEGEKPTFEEAFPQFDAPTYASPEDHPDYQEVYDEIYQELLDEAQASAQNEYYPKLGEGEMEEPDSDYLWQNAKERLSEEDALESMLSSLGYDNISVNEPKHGEPNKYNPEKWNWTWRNEGEDDYGNAYKEDDAVAEETKKDLWEKAMDKAYELEQEWYYQDDDNPYSYKVTSDHPKIGTEHVSYSGYGGEWYWNGDYFKSEDEVKDAIWNKWWEDTISDEVASEVADQAKEQAYEKIKEKIAEEGAQIGAKPKPLPGLLTMEWLDKTANKHALDQEQKDLFEKLTANLLAGDYGYNSALSMYEANYNPGLAKKLAEEFVVLKNGGVAPTPYVSAQQTYNQQVVQHAKDWEDYKSIVADNYGLDKDKLSTVLSKAKDKFNNASSSQAGGTPKWREGFKKGLAEAFPASDEVAAKVNEAGAFEDIINDTYNWLTIHKPPVAPTPPKPPPPPFKDIHADTAFERYKSDAAKLKAKMEGGLDMSFEAREARRIKGGWITKAYKGVSQKDDYVVLIGRDNSGAYDYNRGAFFTNKTEIANAWAGNNLVYPVWLRTKGWKVIDYKGAGYSSHGGNDQQIKKARQEGYTGLWLKNVSDTGGTGDQLIAWQTNDIRSVHARFDEEDMFSGDMLASGVRRVKAELRDNDFAKLKEISRRMKDAAAVVERIAGPIEIVWNEIIPVSMVNLQYKDSEENLAGYYRPARAVGPKGIPADALIGLAFSDPDAVFVGGHEAFHHVERALATPQEIMVMTDPREMARVRKLAIAEIGAAAEARLPDIEVRTYAAQRWIRMKDAGLDAYTGEVHPAFMRLWERIRQFLRRVRNVLRGLGYDTIEDIFEDARTGKFAQRNPRYGFGLAPVDPTEPMARDPNDPRWAKRAAQLLQPTLASGFKTIRGLEGIVTPPPKQPPEKWAGNINLDKIADAEDVGPLLKEMAEHYEGFMGARGGRISHARTREMAALMGIDPAKLAKKRRDMPGMREAEMLAVRSAMVAHGRRVHELAEKAKGGSDEDKVALLKARAQLGAIAEYVAGETAYAGRLLNQFKLIAGEDKELMATFLDTQGQNLDAFIDRVLLLKDPAKVAAFSNRSLLAKTTDVLFELWINALLSGPVTQATNVLSNTLVALYQVPEAFVAGMISKVTGSGIPLRGATYRAFGLMQGISDGVKAAVQAAKTEEPTGLTGKIEARHQKAIPGKLGRAVRIPGLGLLVGDEFYKAVNYRAEISDRALRMAVAEGLKGQALAKRVADLIANPTDRLIRYGRAAAERQTFTNKAGRVAQLAHRAVASIPGLRYVIPFIRTPANIVSFAVRRSPFAPLFADVRADLSGANGTQARDEAIARIALGSMISAWAVYMAAQGLITGGGPDDPKERSLLYATGWQPYSIKIGDTYYSFARFEPLSTLLGVASDAYELQKAMSEEEKANVAGLVIGSITRNLTNKTFLRGLAEVFEVTSDPKRYAYEWVKNFSGTLVPTGVAQLARTRDPYLREARTIVDNLKSRVPGLRESLPKRRDLFGAEIKKEGAAGPDIVSPVFQSALKDNPAAQEMVRLGYAPGMPGRKIMNVELTPEQYEAYAIYAGQNTKEAVGKIMARDSYGRLSNDRQKYLIKRVVDDARERARAQMLRDFPDLKQQAKALRKERRMVVDELEE